MGVEIINEVVGGWLALTSDERLQYVDTTEALYDQLMVWASQGKLGLSEDIYFGAVLPNKLDEIIFKLTRHKDIEDFVHNVDKDKYVRLEALITGPHGWSIYKALIARQDV